MQVFTHFTPEVVALLKNGAVGVIPTDTVYGVVAPLFNEQAVRRIYELKGHDKSRPVGTILINDPLQVEHIIPAAELLKAQVYWPAPISVVLPVPAELHFTHRGHKSLPFRVPDHSGLQKLLTETGPLATSSANHTGKPPAETLEEAMAYFREAADFYVDGGNLSGRQASSILRFNQNGEVEKLR